MRMVALKRLRYPRGGPDGKEYNPGDEFDVPSDRDIKALSLVRLAKEAKRGPGRPRKVETASVQPVQPAPVQQEPAPEAGRQYYRRRDMIAED